MNLLTGLIPFWDRHSNDEHMAVSTPVLKETGKNLRYLPINSYGCRPDKPGGPMQNFTKRAENLPFEINKELSAAEQLFALAEGLITSAGIDPEKMLGVGISMPGLVSSEEGKNFTYFLTEEESESLQQVLAKKFSKPVYIFNDAKSACLEEFHFGQARNKKNEIEFSIKHSKNNSDSIMPRLNHLFDKFLDNEFYAITKKFDKMKEFKIIDTKEFVKEILDRMKLFRYECSDKNNGPSKKSREVLKILDNEALLFDDAPNLWIGYNAFNQMLHNTLKKSFSQQEYLDKKLFDAVYEMA